MKYIRQNFHDPTVIEIIFFKNCIEILYNFEAKRFQVGLFTNLLQVYSKVYKVPWCFSILTLSHLLTKLRREERVAQVSG